MSKRLNIDNLRRYLQEEVGLYGEKLELEKFDFGQSNPTYHVKFGNHELVMRKRPGGKLLRGAHQVGREYRVMKALHSVGFPVPQVIAHCTDNEVIGTEFFLMDFMPGIVNKFSFPGKTDQECKECILSAVETLARLHNISPQDIGLGNYGKTKGFCQRQVNTWWRQYEAAKHKNITEMVQLSDWLKRNLPPDVTKAAIVHGDYSISNIMFHPTKNELFCVLDWELSTLGDPLADIAYFCMPFYMPDELIQYLYNTGSDLSKIITEEEVVRHYCKTRGIAHPLPNLEFYKALACFRLASIIQGVYRRSLQGNASQESADMFGNLVPPMAAAGLKVIRASNPRSLQTTDHSNETELSLITSRENMQKAKL